MAMERHIHWCPVLLLLMVYGPGPAYARESLSGAEPAAAKGALDGQYVDGSFGFALRPPDGAAAFREKRFLGKADVELVRFVKLDDQWSLSVRVSTTTRPLDARLIIEGITSNLTSQHGQVKVLREEPARIASREGVRYAASFTTERMAWLRQQAVIRTKPTEYYALILVTPESDREVAIPLFDKIVGSFEILRSELTQQQIQAGLERGTALLESVAAGRINLARRAGGDIFLQCIQDGKEIGFVHIREQLKTDDLSERLRVRRWAWLFQPDGGITHMRHEMLLAADLSYEEWENRLLVLTPAQANAPRQSGLELDRAIREGNKLLLAYTPELNAPELREKVIEVEKSYASAPWDVLLPRLVDLKKPELYAFSSYDAGRRGLVLRTFRVVGPSPVQIGGRRIPAFKLEDSEGLIPPIHEIYVDEQGRILRVNLHVSGTLLEMVATTRQALERQYGARIEEAERLFQKSPVPEPIPARGPGP